MKKHTSYLGRDFYLSVTNKKVVKMCSLSQLCALIQKLLDNSSISDVPKHTLLLNGQVNFTLRMV